MINSNSELQTMWKSGLVWLSRPLNMVLAIQAKIWSSFWPKLANFNPVNHKFQIFMKKVYSVFKKMWKSGLFWLPRPLDKVLAIWANFGPLRAKISKIAGETPIFYWSPRLYLPIGIQNWPYFGWDISSHFLPWVKFSGETCGT